MANTPVLGNGPVRFTEEATRKEFSVPLADLWHAVPSFPTMSEVWLRLLEAYGP